MKTSEGSGNKDFCWQGGYAAFSVSQSNVSKVVESIENQEEHHRKRSFEDEMRVLFKRHKIEYRGQYVWD